MVVQLETQDSQTWIWKCHQPCCVETTESLSRHDHDLLALLFLCFLHHLDSVSPVLDPGHRHQKGIVLCCTLTHTLHKDSTTQDSLSLSSQDHAGNSRTCGVTAGPPLFCFSGCSSPAWRSRFYFFNLMVYNFRKANTISR